MLVIPRRGPVMKPITDKAEVALEYPDKFYIGTFERSSQFEVHLDETGIVLTLFHGGQESERKSVRMHINYGLFADILSDLAQTVAAMPLQDELHREAFAGAAVALGKALQPAAPPSRTAKATRSSDKR
jgi:hypothetical protein